MIHCEKVTKRFDGIAALDDVSLDFPMKGLVAIIGPNGAGKTTLLNVITGFQRADRGRIRLGNQDLAGLAPHKIARLGIVRTFQDLRLIQRLSALDNVMLACPRQAGESLLHSLVGFRVAKEEKRNRDKAVELLNTVGLGGEVEQLAGTLSYGQQKLLTLACCLVTNAGCLFLDEPLAGVHPDMGRRILGLLSSLRNEQKLIIFIEHDLEAVREVADQVVVLSSGKVLAVGAPVDVLRRNEVAEAYFG